MNVAENLMPFPFSATPRPSRPAAAAVFFVRDSRHARLGVRLLRPLDLELPVVVVPRVGAGHVESVPVDRFGYSSERNRNSCAG